MNWTTLRVPITANMWLARITVASKPHWVPSSERLEPHITSMDRAHGELSTSFIDEASLLQLRESLKMYEMMPLNCWFPQWISTLNDELQIARCGAHDAVLVANVQNDVISSLGWLQQTNPIRAFGVAQFSGCRELDLKSDLYAKCMDADQVLVAPSDTTHDTSLLF